MNIQLKQAEIVDALKQYIAKQGINLTGREVNITFTAGRKDSGLTADLVIEDVSIPGFTDSEEAEEVQALALTVVSSNPELKADAPAEAEPAIDEPDAAPVAKTTSLFS